MAQGSHLGGKVARREPADCDGEMADRIDDAAADQQQAAGDGECDDEQHGDADL